VGFQLDLPRFEALNAQVLGVSVDFNAANTVFAERLGLRFPLLSDTRRLMTRDYGVLHDNPALAGDLDQGRVERQRGGLGPRRPAQGGDEDLAQGVRVQEPAGGGPFGVAREVAR